MRMSDQELPEKIHKPVIRKFKKRIVYSSFINNIWVVDLADMQLISKINKGSRFLLYVIDIFSIYAWIILLKNKKSITMINAFQKILDDSNCKPNKVCVDEGSEFYNGSMKSWLEKNAIEMYSVHIKGKYMLLIKIKI